MSTLGTSIFYGKFYPELLGDKKKWKLKDIQNGMEEVKTISILRLHYLVYRKFIKKLLELKK